MVRDEKDREIARLKTYSRNLEITIECMWEYLDSVNLGEECAFYLYECIDADME